MARLLPGGLVTVNNESITSKMLIDVGIKDPDFMTDILSMDPQIAPLMAWLAYKGNKTKGLNESSTYYTTNNNYRAVSSNHIQFTIANSTQRKEHFMANLEGLTFKDPVSSTYPGQDGRPVWIWLDSNKLAKDEVALLADGKTQIYFLTDAETDSSGAFKYKVKLDGNVDGAYIDPEIMLPQDELGYAYNKHIQDFSKGGSEHHEFHGFGNAYLTLQRFKYSWSGTAAAMDKGSKSTVGRWVMNGSGKGGSYFLTQAQEMMMRNVAKSVDFQLLEGKGTVDELTGKVMLTNDKNQEVLSGSGIMYSGDGAIEFPLTNGWNKYFIESFLTDIDSYVGYDDSKVKEVLVMMAPRSFASFNTAMASMGVTQNMNIVGEGADKIINNTYKGYEFSGVRMVAIKTDALGRGGRPGKILSDGTSTADWDSMVIPTGNNFMGQKMIELVQLRGLVEGMVKGIDQGGDISSEIDGSSKHALIQVGAINRGSVFRIFRPWKYDQAA